MLLPIKQSTKLVLRAQKFICPGVVSIKELFKQHRNFFSSSSSRLQAVNLSYTVYKPDSQLSSSVPVIILHGLLGSKQNWRSIGKVLAAKSSRTVFVLDARNHGDSPHTDDYSYPLMSEDVKHFMERQAISESVLVGHSMGGRTAMYLALKNNHLVNKLVVVDISPVQMPTESSFIPTYMKLMKESLQIISGQNLIQARKLVDAFLSKTIPIVGIRQFLITNLTEENGQLRWKPNLDVLINRIESGLLDFPKFSETYTNDTLFICGGDSPFVKPEDYPNIRSLFAKAQFVSVPGAGHWVHSEKPSEFLDILVKFL